jgi:hypothetical protein
MTSEFAPRLDILPAPQRRLWDELIDLPSSFVLYGGTAIALHLGHRQSVDLEFLSLSAFAPDELYASLSFLKGAEILQSKPSTLACLVDRRGPVHVSFFGLPTLGRVANPLIAPDNGVKVASIVDLAGMKAATVPHRAEAKDYVDLAAMLEAGVVDLPTALAAASAIYGRQFNPQLTLKALCYFEDGNVSNVPQAYKERLVRAVAAVDLGRLPRLRPVRAWTPSEPEVRP